ncbi:MULTISPECIES: serine hydrolase domain-containing protein [unclassified Sphingobium]|uniref:serine hydrolase domain-containing protein n=1 Tax=unclassified Sphingobium TaxID=2611147 RepID=UPI00119DED65|nr:MULTISPECIES: serine hydrolase domain-containing protein [unclassified Sphingobium]MBG6116591.1 CubicO group peptidase (beta-lactamase class C family) [Sphingobium sp. JAI105]
MTKNMSGWSRRSVMAVGAGVIATPGFGMASQGSGLPPKVLDRVREMMRDRRIPAAGIAVVHNGVTMMAAGLGTASLPFEVSANEKTLFHLGSVGKQITAALVFELAEAGTIDLNGLVGRYARGLPDAFAAIPISALLSHTGGVPDYEGLPGFDADRPITREAFLTGVSAVPLDFQPGHAWAYSNTGYVLLGYLLADVTGKSYRDLVTERLLRRAGLSDARVDDASAVIAGRAEPYVLEDNLTRHAVGMSSDYSQSADGGVLMSARDAARWEHALQAGPVPSPATVARLVRPALMSSGRSAAYGAGWFTDEINGRAVQYHSGSVTGFLTFAWRAPSTRTAVTVMVNIESGPAGRFIEEACLMLAEFVAPGSTPLGLVPTQDDAPKVTAQALALLTRGDRPLDPGLFTSEISALMKGPAAGVVVPFKLGADTTGIDFRLVGHHAEPGGHVRRYRITRNGRARHVSFAYAPDGRIYRFRNI